MTRLPPSSLLLLLASSALASSQQSRQLQDTATFEETVLAAWGKSTSCSAPDMCDQCGLGVVVVELDDAEDTNTRIYNVQPNASLPSPWGPDASVEIASMTKPFTSIAMLVLQEEGIVKETDTLGELLTMCDFSAAKSDVASVTLLELAQHESGFPPMPPDLSFQAFMSGNPYFGYTDEDLCGSLNALEALPTRRRYAYSNYAYGTLGLAIAIAADSGDYETMMKEKLFHPLGMFNTTVTLTPEEWQTAQGGCGRGGAKSTVTIRNAPYSALQGNGAIRSTLNDMAKYMEVALKVDADISFEDEGLTNIVEAIKVSQSQDYHQDLACSCVSGWCMGTLCQLPNPNHEFITPGGMEGYTSAGSPAWRKSGDTTAFSGRIAFSGAKGRAALAIDSCGACGEGSGAVGSASQRATLLLADGPPPAVETSIAAVEQPVTSEMAFTGFAHSPQYASLAEIVVKVTPASDATVSVALSGSDGYGAVRTATWAEEGVWRIDGPIYYGTGPAFIAMADTLAQVPQQRTLTIAEDGKTALLQELGADLYLTLEAKEEDVGVVDETGSEGSESSTEDGTTPTLTISVNTNAGEPGSEGASSQEAAGEAATTSAAFQPMVCRGLAAGVSALSLALL